MYKSGYKFKLDNNDITELQAETDAHFTDCSPEYNLIPRFLEAPTYGADVHYMTSTDIMLYMSENALLSSAGIKINQKILNAELKKLGFKNKPVRNGAQCVRCYEVVKREFDRILPPVKAFGYAAQEPRFYPAAVPTVDDEPPF